MEEQTTTSETLDVGSLLEQAEHNSRIPQVRPEQSPIVRPKYDAAVRGERHLSVRGERHPAVADPNQKMNLQPEESETTNTTAPSEDTLIHEAAPANAFPYLGNDKPEEAAAGNNAREESSEAPSKAAPADFEEIHPDTSIDPSDPTLAYTSLAKDGTNPNTIETSKEAAETAPAQAAKAAPTKAAAEPFEEIHPDTSIDPNDPTLAYTALAKDGTNPNTIETSKEAAETAPAQAAKAAPTKAAAEPFEEIHPDTSVDPNDPTLVYTALAKDGTNPNTIETPKEAAETAPAQATEAVPTKAAAEPFEEIHPDTSVDPNDPTLAYTALAEDGTNPNTIETPKEATLEKASLTAETAPTETPEDTTAEPVQAVMTETKPDAPKEVQPESVEPADPTLAYTSLANDHTNPVTIEKPAQKKGHHILEKGAALTGLAAAAYKTLHPDQEPKVRLDLNEDVLPELEANYPEPEKSASDFEEQEAAGNPETEALKPEEAAKNPDVNTAEDGVDTVYTGNEETSESLQAEEEKTIEVPHHRNPILSFFSHPWVGITAAVCCLGLLGAVVGFSHHSHELTKELVKKTNDLNTVHKAYSDLANVNKINEAKINLYKASTASYKNKLEQTQKALIEANSAQEASQKALEELNKQNGTAYTLSPNASDNADTISYNKLVSNPSAYAGDQVTFDGKILLADKSGDQTRYIVSLTSSNGDQILVLFPGSPDAEYQAGDMILVNGESAGLGSTVFNGTREIIPMISADEIAGK